MMLLHIIMAAIFEYSAPHLIFPNVFFGLVLLKESNENNDSFLYASCFFLPSQEPRSTLYYRLVKMSFVRWEVLGDFQ